METILNPIDISKEKATISLESVMKIFPLNIFNSQLKKLIGLTKSRNATETQTSERPIQTFSVSKVRLKIGSADQTIVKGIREQELF